MGNKREWFKKTSYLYGTYHSKDARVHEMGDSVLTKLVQSDALVTEIVELDEELERKSLEMMLMKDKKLEDLLTSVDYSYVRDNAMKRMGATGILHNTMKPLFFIALLVHQCWVEDIPMQVPTGTALTGWRRIKK